tara:strand:- start:1120 stop:1290 length:171 start_codon:yes stop_codon:yes gene_type:complete
MKDKEYVINTGGMFRCCIQQIQERYTSEIDEIKCKHCKSKLVKENNVWRVILEKGE